MKNKSWQRSIVIISSSSDFSLPESRFLIMSRVIKCVWPLLTFFCQSRESSQMTLMLWGTDVPPPCSYQQISPVGFLICLPLNYPVLQRASEASNGRPGGYAGLNWEDAWAADGLLTLHAEIMNEGMRGSELITSVKLLNCSSVGSWGTTDQHQTSFSHNWLPHWIAISRQEAQC